MNTKDYSELKGVNLERIFHDQEKLMYLYEPVLEDKVKNFDINIFEDQELIKGFLLQRVIEELVEACISFEKKDHFEEEVVDAFNFLVESYILYGYRSKDLDSWIDEDRNLNYKDKKLSILQVIEQIGLTCNLLKNRPWRKSQYVVDLLVFEREFKKIWINFNSMCDSFNILKKDLIKLWSLKYQVNLFRLKSQY